MMRHQRILLSTIGATALIASAWSGAAAQDESAAPPSCEPSAFRARFSVWDMQYEFFQAMEVGTREAAEARCWSDVLHDQKSDVNEMVTGATALLDEVDVLIISPNKPDALGPIVAAAKEKGVPVVVDDIGGGGTPYDAIVLSDNAGGGTIGRRLHGRADQGPRLAQQQGRLHQLPARRGFAARRNEAFEARIKELRLRRRGRPLGQLGG